MAKKSLRETLDALMKSGQIKLISSHPRLSYPVIERLYKKMSIGVRYFGPIHIHENLIIDGHHRYVASLLAGYEIEQIQWVRPPVKKEEAWEFIDFYDYDWYLPEKIRDLDEQDALELGLSYEQLREKMLSL